MPKYRKKITVEIEAFRLGLKGEPIPAPRWFGTPRLERITEEGVLIDTGIGIMLARWGDWIMRTPTGLRIESDNVFNTFWELVED